MTGHTDDPRATTRHKRECHRAGIDMTGYDYTTARSGDSRSPWPQQPGWRTHDESADTRGTMYWGAGEAA